MLFSSCDKVVVKVAWCMYPQLLQLEAECNISYVLSCGKVCVELPVVERLPLVLRGSLLS